MILWIDGPYGVGKSTLAEELVKLNKNSFIFDAESVGNAVRDNMPRELFNGYIFENYGLWFKTIEELLKEIVGRYNGDIYVPMTLTKKDSFDKIAIPLKNSGVEVTHLLLEADYENVKNRILARGEEENCWCMQNIALCLEIQKTFLDVIRLNTINQSPYNLAKVVYDNVLKKKNYNKTVI